VENRAILLKKLHSLSGVFPLGAFLVLHLATNARALGGQGPFSDAVTASTTRPYVGALELVLLFVPLGFHAGYGIWLSLSPQQDREKHQGAERRRRRLQRLTGVLTLGFLLTHVYQYRYARMSGELVATDFYDELSASLSSTVHGVPLMALGYLVGLGAATFHFSHGLHDFCCSWGIVRSPRGIRIGFLASRSIAVLLFALGAAITLHFATGTRLSFTSDARPGAPDGGKRPRASLLFPDRVQRLVGRSARQQPELVQPGGAHCGPSEREAAAERPDPARGPRLLEARSR
jgi:succinate dehydrogenase / fumarate reductase cytochrome b subunit